MYLGKDEILHLANKKSYRVKNFELLDNTYYYLLENIENNKYIVVTCKEVNSELYLKKEVSEEILKKLKF